MELSAGTLNGQRATDARASIPKWGCWYADATLDGDVAIAGAATLKIADLSLTGTILSGGSAKGRSYFRLVAGKGGWGKTIKRRSYSTDAGVKISTVLTDAAADAGETLDASTLPTGTLGPAWVRPEGPASAMLQLLAPQNWYVGEDGITRIGRRPKTQLAGTVTKGVVDRAARTVTLAAESIATILPGVVVEDLEAVDVLHELSAKELRSTLWGASSTGTSRRIAALQKLLEQLDPGRRFRGFSEYRVVSLSGARLNLQAVRVSTGMPDLRNVPIRPGVAGAKPTASLGARVLVGFADATPARPFVGFFEEPGGGGFASEGLELVTDGIGAPGHAVSLEQLLGILANLICVLAQQSALSPTFTSSFTSPVPPGPPTNAQTALITIMQALTQGVVTPLPIGIAGQPGGILDPILLPAAIASALGSQLPDPASAGLPIPVMPGLARKALKI